MSPLTWGVLDVHVQVGLLVLDVSGFQSLALKPVPNRLGGISSCSRTDEEHTLFESH